MPWKALIVVAVSSCLLACATAQGPTYVAAPRPEGGKALVYIYRQTLGYFQSAYTPRASVDGKPLADLPRDSYTYAYVDPGEHTIAVKHNFLAGIPSVQLALHAASGGVYFISYQDPIRPGASIIFYIAKIQSFSGKSQPSELQNMRYVEPIR